MRVLMVSYLFPPSNAIGAVRAGKTAKYLHRFGHEVHVLTAERPPLPQTLRLEVPAELVHPTRWWNINAPVEWALGGRQRVAMTGYVPADHRQGAMGKTLRALGSAYKHLLHLPDGQIGWYRHALQEAELLFRRWRPQIILASGAPFTSFLIARTLAAKYDIPWVAELRDLWADNANRTQPRWRLRLDGALERTVLGSASCLITVSEPLADTLRGKYNCAVHVVRNGFDPDDYADEAELEPMRSDGFNIVYTGMVYDGKQDPSPLFEAIRMLGDAAQGLNVSFYGRYLDSIRDLAHAHGVADHVEVCAPVAHEAALQLQQRADALLLLLWTDRAERGVFTGKLFEYIGARRPVLAVGPSDNVAAELVRERRAGVATASPQMIADHLRHWMQQKREHGHVPALPADVGAGLTREEATRATEAVLAEVLEAIGTRELR